MSTAFTIRHLLRALDARYPLSRAESWDKVGLLIGDAEAPVSRVLVAHEVTDDVLEETQGFEALVVYHPPLFRPLERLDFADHTARLAGECIRRGLNVVAVHTALDNAPKPHALGDALAASLGLHRVGVLGASGREALFGITVYVPRANLEAVQHALWNAGAGQIGHYGDASFFAPGTGTFRPQEGAKPHIGTIGELARVEEMRLEVIVRERDRDGAVRAMLQAHPYEQAAYRVHALHNALEAFGPARVGELAEEMALDALAARVGEVLRTDLVRVVRAHETVRKIACVAGSGASFIAQAARAGCHALVTGDIKHHDALQARALGLSLVDVPHTTTERAALSMIADALQGIEGVAVVRCEVDTNPFN